VVLSIRGSLYYSTGFQEYLKTKEKELPEQIREIEKQIDTPGVDKEELRKELAAKENELSQVKEYLEKWSPDQFKKLSVREQSLYNKAFTTNIGDPDYHKVEYMAYALDGEKRVTKVPNHNNKMPK
jgi:phospholipase C